MLDLFNQIIWINLILFLYFNTDMVYNYLKLLNLKIFKINEFDNYKIDCPKADYFSYLRINHSSFIIRLITCKPCFLFWLCLLTCLLFGNIVSFAFLYLTSYISYKLLNKYVY